MTERSRKATSGRMLSEGTAIAVGQAIITVFYNVHFSGFGH